MLVKCLLFRLDPRDPFWRRGARGEGRKDGHRRRSREQSRHGARFIPAAPRHAIKFGLKQGYPFTPSPGGL